MKTTLKISKLIVFSLIMYFGSIPSSNGGCAKLDYKVGPAPEGNGFKKVIRFNFCCGFYAKCKSGGSSTYCTGTQCIVFPAE